MTEPLATANPVVEYLRSYNMNARVLLLAPTPEHAEYVLTCEKGLLSLFGDEFSAVNSRQQLTHRNGGLIRVVTLKTPNVTHRLAGQLHGIVWADNLTPPDKSVGTNHVYYDARQEARLTLRLPPYQWIESKDGFITAVTSNA